MAYEDYELDLKTYYWGTDAKHWLGQSIDMQPLSEYELLMVAEVPEEVAQSENISLLYKPERGYIKLK